MAGSGAPAAIEDRRPADILEAERDYYLERVPPAYGNLSLRDISSRARKSGVRPGRESARPGMASIWTSPKDRAPGAAGDQ